MDDPTLGPQFITETDWYYELPRHMLLVHEVRSKEGLFIRTDQIKIPWRQIKKSMERSYRPRRKKNQS